MSLTISFSFDSETEKQKFQQYARLKGMKLSALAKMEVYQYKAKYPHRNEKMSKGEARKGGVLGSKTDD